MGFIPQVTCRRCGTKFSAMRHRCPACGTRRVKNSSRAPGTTPGTVKGTPAAKAANENRKWQLIFGAILIVAIIVALIVMISISLKNADNPNAPSMPTTPPEVSAMPTPTPTPTPTPEVTELSINYAGNPLTEFACRVGDSVSLTGSHFPLTVAAEYEWSVADEGVATVSEDGTVRGVGPGTTTVTLTCYGKTATCTVYVRS